MEAAPSVRVVFFTAAWCPNCQVLGPQLSRALVANPSIERIDIDITNDALWDQSLERALDKGVVRLYNAYVGTTGFAVIAATDTGETIQCVTRAHDARAIEAHIATSLQIARSRPAGGRALGRETGCPKERAPPA